MQKETDKHVADKRALEVYSVKWENRLLSSKLLLDELSCGYKNRLYSARNN